MSTNIDKHRQFEDVVQLIKQAKGTALRLVNTTLIDLYWNVGKYVSIKTAKDGWGKSTVSELAKYINSKDPNIDGFSDKNIWRMKQFYEIYIGDAKLSPLVREINWTNNLIIFSRSKSVEEREFYLRYCIMERYSKRELERQISASLFERTMLTDVKLSPMLREIHSDAANSFRDSYTFEFLGKTDIEDEKDLRKGLVKQMKEFILELGKDFIFIGEEYRVQVGNGDFYIDLLFYHRGLQCLVAFELKDDKFKPEFIGKLDFYLEALDRDVKKANENPSIGVLLCKDKDNEVVEYALSRSLSPTMVAEYKMQLPDKKILQQKLHELSE